MTVEVSLLLEQYPAMVFLSMTLYCYVRFSLNEPYRTYLRSRDSS